MPHVVVEYSANIAAEADIPGLLQAIARTIRQADVFPVAGIRVRALEYRDYVIADDDPDYAFVAITARVAKGRPEADRRRTFDAVFEAVKAHLKPVNVRKFVALSLDVEEFGDRLAYKDNRLHEKFGTKPFAQTVG